MLKFTKFECLEDGFVLRMLGFGYDVVAVNCARSVDRVSTLHFHLVVQPCIPILHFSEVFLRARPSSTGCCLLHCAHFAQVVDGGTVQFSQTRYSRRTLKRLGSCLTRGAAEGQPRFRRGLRAPAGPAAGFQAIRHATRANHAFWASSVSAAPA